MPLRIRMKILILLISFFLSFPFSLFSSTDNSVSVPKIAKWYLMDDVVRVDTEAKTITLPNSLVIMAGSNQSKAFGWSGGATFSYDVKGMGNGCKVVFNPYKSNNDSKFYVVSRDHSLSAEEYYFCGIILNPFHLDIPSEKVLVDGVHPFGNKDQGKNSVIYYDGEKIEIPSKPRNALACEFVGELEVSNDHIFNGKLFYAQGMAIYGRYMFRIGYGHNDKRTICQVFELNEEYQFKLVNRFYLGYNSGYAHANTCQFGNKVDSKSGFPLLYTRNGDKHACIVERVSLQGAEMVQRINIDYKNIFHHGAGEGNTVMGDDGYIWYFGEANGYQYFAKFTPPSLDKKEVTLTIKDLKDAWELPVDDTFIDRTWQGGKVKGGKIYFLYGKDANSNRLYVIDIKRKKRVALIPLSSIIDEVEDLDFTESSLLISISSAKNGIYRLNEINY